MLRRYRHIIWDWNGTLLDDVDLCINVMNTLLRRHGMAPIDRPHYHVSFGFPVRDYYARLGFDVSEENFRRLSAEFIAEYERRRFEATLHAGAEALLEAINARGRTQSILSAYSQTTLREIVDHFGLTSRFVRIDGLDNIYAHSKAELGRACLAQLGVPASEVLMIGDTLHDLEVATELGMDCVLVAHGHQSPDRLRLNHRLVFANLTGLAPVLGLSIGAMNASDSGFTVARRSLAEPIVDPAS